MNFLNQAAIRLVDQASSLLDETDLVLCQSSYLRNILVDGAVRVQAKGGGPFVQVVEVGDHDVHSKVVFRDASGIGVQALGAWSAE